MGCGNRPLFFSAGCKPAYRHMASRTTLWTPSAPTRMSPLKVSPSAVVTVTPVSDMSTFATRLLTRTFFFCFKQPYKSWFHSRRSQFAMGYVCLPVQSKTSERGMSVGWDGTVESRRVSCSGVWVFIPRYHVFQHVRNMSKESAVRVVQVCVM